MIPVFCIYVNVSVDYRRYSFFINVITSVILSLILLFASFRARVCFLCQSACALRSNDQTILIYLYINLSSIQFMFKGVCLRQLVYVFWLVCLPTCRALFTGMVQGQFVFVAYLSASLSSAHKVQGVHIFVFLFNTHLSLMSVSLSVSLPHTQNPGSVHIFLSVRLSVCLTHF